MNSPLGASQQGINREFLENPPIAAKNCPENICEFSRLRDLRDEIPCATEQGINSTTTGVQFAPNRELIRDNRESMPPWGSEQKNGSTAIRSSRGSTWATGLAAASGAIS
jgi:hypothetical protein